MDGVKESDFRIAKSEQKEILTFENRIVRHMGHD